MDRKIIYPSQIPLVEDQLHAARFAQIGIGRIAGALYGEGGIGASGFDCTPGSGLAVTIAPGELILPGIIDASTYSVLPASESALPRQYILSDPLNLLIPSSGATYLVYGTPLTEDTSATVLPYYNSANPSQTFAGAGNTGTSQPTVRSDTVTIAIGTALPAGGTPLWSIAVPSGATSITAAMIAPAVGAPFFPSLNKLASRIVAPFDPNLAAAFGGYPSKSIVADPNTSGVYWISTTDDNLTTPGASGASWVSLFAPVQQGRLLGTTRITSSTTYVPPAGTRYVEVDLGGAGGGSGGVPAPANSSQVNVSTGGNAGSFLKVTITDPSVFTNAPVVIGGYGQGGAIGTHDGVPGGTTSFANYSAPGGAGGKTTTVTAFPFAGLATGASPGSPSAGDIAYVGAAPTGWIAISPTVGVTSIGGASPWGPGGYAAIGIDGGAQGAAGGFGAGAGGVMAPGNYTQGLAGANGGQGYCVVRAYS